jgi:hypothetical protein
MFIAFASDNEANSLVSKQAMLELINGGLFFLLLITCQYSSQVPVVSSVADSPAVFAGSEHDDLEEIEEQVELITEASVFNSPSKVPEIDWELI